MAEATGLRNVALPYPVYGCPFGIVVPILDADGDLVTGASSLDSEVSKNGDTFADCTNEATEIATSSGFYYLLLTATEMTADVVAGIVKTGTSGAKTTAFTLYPRKLPVLSSGTCQGSNDTGDIQLASGDVAIDDYYNGCLVVAVIDGTTEARIINDYVGSTKVAEVSPAWNTAQPDSNDTYTIYQPEGLAFVRANATHLAGTAQTARDIGASVLLSSGTGTGQVTLTSGRVNADVTHIATAAVSTSTAQLGVNVVNFGGSAGTFSSGRPEVNTSHAAGTAWNSGAIGASTLASDTIAAAKIATGAITAAKFAAGAIDAAAIADNAIDAGALAADCITAAKIADGAIDAATFAAGAINAAAIAADAIGASELAADAVAEIADAVWDEATSGHTTSGTFGQAFYVVRANTAQAGGATTITLDASASATDDIYNYDLIVLTGGTGAGQARYITDYNGTTKVATVASWQTNPSSDTVFMILPGGQIPGATAPTAGEVADAVWDEAQSGHTTAGTFGRYLDAQVANVETDTQDIQSRLPAALVSGRMSSDVVAISGDTAAADNLEAAADGTGYNLGGGSVVAASVTGAVGSVAAGGITASSIADGAIDRATFAADTGLQSIRSNTAQAGGATTITLDASASSTADYYKGCLVYITGGTGAGQYRIIGGYNGTTKVADVTPAWATNPDNTSTFAVLPRGAANTVLWESGQVSSGTTGVPVVYTRRVYDSDSTSYEYLLNAGVVQANVVSMNADSVTASALAADAVSETATGVWAAATRTLTSAANITSTGGTITVSAAGGVTLADGVAHGGTLGSSTATLALSRINVTAQTLNSYAVSINSNGAGTGLAISGASTGAGVAIAGGGGGGDGVRITTFDGDGVVVTTAGASRHGVVITGGDSGTSDGVKLVAGSGGVALRAGSVTVTGATTLSGAVSLGSTLSVTGAITATNASNALTLGTFTVTTNAVAWNAAWDTEVQSEVQDAIEANNLDHLLKIAVDTNFATTVHADSAIGQLADNGAGFDRTTDSLEAIRDRGDAAWTTATGFSTLDAAGVRTAVGLASANLDTQLAAIDDYIDSEVAAVKAKTDLIPAGGFPSNFSALAITAGGIVDADVETWRGTQPLALSSQKVQAEASSVALATGTVASTTGTTTTLDSGAVATADYYVSARLILKTSTGAGQERLITAYSSSRVATHAAWTTNPDATTTYEIQPGRSAATATVDPSDILDAALAEHTTSGTVGGALYQIHTADVEITVASPLSDSGRLSLNRGFDYDAGDNRAIDFAGTSWVDLTGGTVTFVVGGQSYSMSIVSSGGATQTVRLQLTAAQTRAMPAGPYRVVLTQADGDVIPLTEGRLYFS